MTTTASGSTVRARSAKRAATVTRRYAAGRQWLSLLRALGVTRVKPGRYRVLIEPRATDGRAGVRTAVYLWVLKPRTG